MFWIVLILVIAICVFLPGLWVKHVMQKYSQPADRYRKQGSGGELARHLLDSSGLSNVVVEETSAGDHYDPVAKAVRLTPDNYSGYSLTAVTVAAHEVGHAIQDSRGEALFLARQKLVKTAMVGERIAGIMLVAAPLVLMLTRLPQAGAITIMIGIVSMALSTMVHLLTLPVEFDASYGKALPILKEGGYLHDGDLEHAEKILKAAALTYVAASLTSLLNLGRWIAVLRR
ncbi:zinc metallopeptidase [Vibrio breoganii]|uniref:zinc metallopeptidase n=1 Tax=Vibrio breoganii TaxID=553239 RepID=UPI00080EA30C|nr:zinc metallopeptidase [Vibrio breoganii]OCH73724.1 peptidase [Vibrio breoganii]PMK21982.1 peptidase [Vibrio breoganii]PML14792.1 peptidase [Vibrio breoganii]PML20227.1 peptidase [Vibrio breoganii]PML38255.1 peptidase [Vibrio breoganii]